MMSGKGRYMSRLRSVALAAFVILAFLALTASSAPAAEKHVFEQTIGTPGTGTGQLSEPAGLAVGETGTTVGDIYVADKGNNRVQYFSPTTGLALGEFNGAAAPSGPLLEPTWIAIDNNPLSPSVGDVYVYDSGHGVIDKFTPTGGFVGEIKEAEAGKPFAPILGIATDPAGHLWVFQSNVEPVGEEHEIDEFDGAAVNGLLSRRFDPLGVSPGFAVDGTDDLYVNRGDSTAAKLNADAEVLIERVNEREAAATAVDLSNDHVFLYNVTGSEGSFISVFDPAPGCTASVRCETAPASSALESFGVANLSRGQGLAVDAATGAVYATDAATGQIEAFEALILPDVETQAASAVNPTTAILDGAVDPDEVPLTACSFEWGESEAFGHTAPCEDPDAAEVGGGNASVPVHAEVKGLAPGTIYFFRLTAANANGANPGNTSQNQTFTTSGARIDSTSASTVSADGAVLGATIDPNNNPTTYYFEYGHTTSYGLNSPMPPGRPVGVGNSPIGVSTQVLGLSSGSVYHYRVVARSELSPGVFETFDGPDRAFLTQTALAATVLPDSRQWQLVSPTEKHGARIEPIAETGVIEASSDGRAITYLASAPTEAEPQGYSNDVQILSRRLDSGWDSQDISIPHTAATGVTVGLGQEYRFFSQDLSKGFVEQLGAFLPLSSGASEQTAYERSNFPFGQPERPCNATCYMPLVSGCPSLGACPQPVQEVADVPAGTIFGNNREDGQCATAAVRLLGFHCRPNFIAATPDGAHVVIESEVDLTPATPGATAADLYERSDGALVRVGGIPASKGPQTFHAISADGSRIVFNGTSSGLSGLLLRDTADNSTLKLDATETGCSTCTGGEGEFQLATPDASHVFFTDINPLTADSGAEPHAPDLYECRIVEPSAGRPECVLTDLSQAGSGREPAQGVLGASADGNYVYYAAGPAAAPRVYVLHEGATELIGALSETDANDWRPFLAAHTARVSPSGQWLAFLSQRPLTGYDNRDAHTGQLDMEVYLYHAASGSLLCASCDPTGARPNGIPYGKLRLAGGYHLLANLNQEVAAIVPGGIPLSGLQSLYQPRYLSDSGRLFFNSDDALVPSDVNGTMDVYQYEPPGVGNCRGQSPSFSSVSGGCVDLLSSGSSPLESAFLDASESGNDVFFITSARLAPQDVDSEVDVYDAHVCNAEAPCLPAPTPAPPVCSGDACQLPATPPDHPTPGTALLNGPGNVVGCPKGKVQQKGKCVNKQHKKSKKKKHRKGKSKNSKGKKQKKSKRATSKDGGHK
jgi:hypothetical protein